MQHASNIAPPDAGKNYRRLTVVPVLGNSSIRSSHSVSPPVLVFHSARVHVCACFGQVRRRHARIQGKRHAATDRVCTHSMAGTFDSAICRRRSRASCMPAFACECRCRQLPPSQTHVRKTAALEELLPSLAVRLAFVCVRRIQKEG